MLEYILQNIWSMCPLQQSISREQLIAAVGAKANDKVTGVDGLPAEIYKTYVDLLLPHLLATMQEALKSCSLPP